MHGRQRDGGDREHDRLGLLVPRAENPGESAEDHGRRESVEEVARQQVDEQRHRRRHVSAVPSPQRSRGPLVSPTPERHRQELEQEDRDVEADAPRDLEHGRVLRRLQGELVGVPRQAEVGEERDHHEGVAQEAHQDGGAAQPVEILSLEDIDHARHRERARSHRDPHQVEEDPQAPRVGVGEVRAGAEPQGEARDERDGAERHEQEEDPVERGQHLLPERLELDVAVVLGMLRRSRCVRHLLSPLPKEGVRGAEQGAHAYHRGGTAPSAVEVNAVKGFSPYVGKPSFSNGTLDRYSTVVPPSSFSP